MMKTSTLLTMAGVLVIGGAGAMMLGSGGEGCALCRVGSSVARVFSGETPPAGILLTSAQAGDDAPKKDKAPEKPATQTAVMTELTKKAMAEAAKAKDADATKNDPKAGSTTMAMPEKTELAMFGGGCFWGVEASFRRVPGVVATEVGFAGGHVENPTYKQVCYTDTGHAEVVRVVFDPSKVTYEKLLDVFFKVHDPTQVNRQGPDIGTQYRTVIFTYSPEQKALAEKKKTDLDASKKFKRPIATQIVPVADGAGKFTRAEDYHQQYLEKRGMESCHIPLPEAEDEPATAKKP